MTNPSAEERGKTVEQTLIDDLQKVYGHGREETCARWAGNNAAEQIRQAEQATRAEWPQRGPDFNLWASDAARFVRLVQANPRLWGKNSQLKYLMLRIDTRDGCYFRLEDRDGQDISPDTVMDAIRALAKDDSEAANA